MGDSNQSGDNTFQSLGDAGPNQGAGLCLDLFPDAGQMLNAIGDTFATANCATTAATLVQSSICAGGADYGVASAGSTIELNLCR